MSNNLTLSVTLTGDGKQLSGTLKNAQGEVQAFGGTTEREGGRAERSLANVERRAGTVGRELQVLRRLAAPVGAALAGMFATRALQGQVDYADQLQKTNLRIGASVEALSQYNHVASLSGVAFGNLTTAWQRQTRRISEAAQGTGAAKDALEALGLSAKELNQLAPEDQFERIAEALQGVESQADRTALAMKLWDTEGVGLLQITNQGTDAIRAMREEADRLGLTISQDTADAMANYNDEMARFQAVATGVTRQVASELVPVMTTGLQTASGWVDQMGGAAEILDTVKDAGTGVAVVMAGRYVGAIAASQAALTAKAAIAATTTGTLNLLTGATTRQAAAATAMAGATRVAAGALALIGGPVGAAVIAAGAVIYFREELGLVPKPAITAAGAVDELAQRVDGAADSMLKFEVAAFTAELVSLQAAAQQAEENLARLERTANEPYSYGQGQQGDLTAGADRQRAQLESLNNQINAREDAIAKLTGRIEQMNAADEDSEDAQRELQITIDGLNNTTEKAVAGTNELTKSTEAQADALEDLYDRLIPGRRETVQLARDMQTLTLAMAMGTGNIGQNIQAIGLLQQQYIEAQNDTDDLADKTVKAAFTMEGAFDELRLNGLRRLDDGFADMWLGAVDGSRNASDTIKRVWDQTLAELLHMSLSRPVTVQLATSMGLNGGGGSQQAGGSQSFGGIPSLSGMMNGSGAIANAYRAFQGTGSTYAGTFGSELAVQTEGGLRAGFKSFAASGLGNAALGIGGGLAGGYAGTAIGSAVFGKNANSNYGAMGGAALGQALIPIPGLGAAIGGALGGVVDSLFGSSKKTFDFDFKQGGNYGVFGDRQGALGDFGVTSFSDFKMDQQDELQELMNSIADFDNVLAAAAIPDRLHAMKESVDGFAYSGPEGLFDARLREIVDGSGALVESAIAQIVDPQQMADTFLSVLNIESLMQSLDSQIQSDVATHLEANTQDIQGTTNSLTQAINATVMLGNSAERLNLQFDDTAGGAIHYAWSLQEAVGGLDALSNKSASYYQNYFTAAEREAMHREELTRTMQELGFELPETREGFRALMEAQNLNTTAGVQNAAALMQLEGAFAQLTPAVSEAGDAVRSTSDILQERAQLERELLRAQGDTAALRELELSEIDKSNQGIKQRIWAIQDAERAEAERQRELDRQAQEAARAAQEAARAYEQAVAASQRAIDAAQQQVVQSFQRFDQQQFGMQIELLALMGDSEAALALERERELASIDESLRPMRERIWSMQDEAEAQERATKAAQNYIGELTRVRDQLSQQLGNIGNWLDQQQATGGTPEMNLANAQEQLARQLVLAENGDRDALQNITQYADRVLQANDAYNASSPAGQRIEQDVFDALKNLPKALSDAEFIVEGFRGIVSNEMAAEIERAIFASQYKIDTLIDFAADASALPQDLRTILGEQAHRLDSTLNYLLGENQLDAELRQLALTSSNNLVATVDYIARRQLSDSDKLLALSSSNTMSAIVDYVVGSELDRDSKHLALESSNAYSAMINMILGRDITADDRTLALDSANRYTTLVDYVVRAELTGGNRRLALSSLNEYQTLIDYSTRADVSSDDRKLALTSGNRYLSTLDYIVGKDIDDGSKEIALSSSNRYLTTVNLVLGSNLSSADRRLALNSTNRYNALIKYVVDSPIKGDDRRLALSAGQQYEALVGYYVNRDITKSDRTLALNSANQYLANVEFIVGRDISSSDRKLALNANNRYVSTIDQLIGKKITGDDRRLALNSTNAYLTTVDAVLKRGISADVRTFGLANSNAIMTTVDGILASKMSGDVRTLALKSSNQFVTTLEAALKDGRITGDERKLLDAKSANVIKTLKTSGSLNLSSDEWAVINAASGSKRLELLADVAFGRTDLDHLKDIDDNTKPLAERAHNQLVKLNGLVREMTKSTGELVDLNGSMVSLSDAISQLRSVMSSRASDTSVRNAARDTVGKLSGVEGKANSSAISNRAIANFFDKAGNPNWGLRVSMSYHQDASAVRSFGYHAAKEMRSEFNANGLRVAVGWGHSSNGAEALAKVFKRIMGANVNGSHFSGLDRVPFDGYVAELHKDEAVLTAAEANAMRDLSSGGSNRVQPAATRNINPAPIPSYPLLGKNDVAELLRDLKREVAELRKENAKLQGESHKHLAAANNQRGAATKAQIEAIEKGNKMFKRMEEDKRMEVAKR
ncbi:hypothetical protein ACDI10_16355 [Vreelandella venusta]|uniref:hypothetical protein n=1 Tax=Vreelandella venusta TaxID=44935 RepID=UPI003556C0AF